MKNSYNYLIEINEILVNDVLKNIDKLIYLIENNYNDVLLSLQESINYGITQMQNLKNEGINESIRYISFSILFTSLLIEKPSLGINFYGENFYLSEIPIFSEWELKYILHFIDNSIENIKHKLKRINIPSEKSYIFELKQNQLFIYALVWGVLLKYFIADVLKNVDKSEFLMSEIDVTFGLYMEKQTIIYKWRV